MKLGDINRFFKINSNDMREVSRLTLNSEEANEETIFIALKGDKHDGKDYIESAIKSNSPITISETFTKDGLYIPSIRNCLTPFSMYFYGNPEKKIKLIGVTGTEGKSTTAYLIHSLLNALGHKALLITTNDGVPNSVKTVNTTPWGPELGEIFTKAVKERYSFVVMECSSIGIANHKLRGLSFEIGVLTNLRQDHLDFHKTRKEYHKVKMDFLKQQAKQIVSLKKTQFHHPSLKIRKNKAIYRKSYYISHKSQKAAFLYHNIYFKTNFLFKYNIENILLAIEAVHQLGFSYCDIRDELKYIEPLKGRAMVVSDNPLVYIDYAHTASALKTSVKAIKKANKDKKLILVFGAGGDREKSKRAKYGKVARKYAYLSIITTDNNRSEEFMDIARMIIGRHKSDFVTIKERKKAIERAMHYGEDYVIAIVGKGAETTITIDDKTIFYSDEEEVRKWLKK